MGQKTETIKQVYLTNTEGKANKHYLYAIQRQSKPSGHLAGVVEYYLQSGWGSIGGAIRTNSAKRISGGEEDAIRAMRKEVRKRTDKGYVKAQVKRKHIARESMPDWWIWDSQKEFAAEDRAKKLEKFKRKDAPWAF